MVHISMSTRKQPSSPTAEPCFERYVPQRDLPDEIKELPVDETRCRFCGVSYLVHHEVKRLEDLVEGLRKQFDDLSTRHDELLETLEREEKRGKELDKEIACTKNRLESKELHLQQYQSLLPLVVEINSQCSTVVMDAKTRLSAAFKSIVTEFQTVRRYHNLSASISQKERENHQSALASIVKEWKEVVSTKEAKMTQLLEELKDKDVITEAVKAERNEMRHRCESIETELLKANEQLKLSKNEVEQLLKQHMVLQQEKKESEEHFNKEKSFQANEISDFKTKLNVIEGHLQSVMSEQERLEKSSAEKNKVAKNLHRQLTEKDKEIELLKVEIERDQQKSSIRILALEKQLTKCNDELLFHASESKMKMGELKELLTQQHQQALVKLQAVADKDKTAVVESLKQQHKREMEHYKAKLEKCLQEAENIYKSRIEELEISLSQEKQTLDAEISRHVSEIKELMLTLNQYQVKLNHQMAVIEEFEKKANSCLEEDKRKESELVLSLRGQVSKLEAKLVEMGGKLNNAYTEITDLQSIVEKQVHERQELIEHYNIISSQS